MKDLELKYCFTENRKMQNPSMCPHFNYNNHPVFKMLTGDETDGYLFCNKADKIIKEVKSEKVFTRIKGTEIGKEKEAIFEFISKIIGNVEAPEWCPLKKGAK
jgi:hypothetical protein